MADTDALLRMCGSIWDSIDELFGRFDELQWASRHGDHWTFADVPFHLGYFDQEMIADGIGRGPGPDAGAHTTFRTRGDLDSWNDEHFDGRDDSAVDVALEQMRRSRLAVRDAVASATEDTSVFIPLPGIGATTVDGALATLQMHTWSHFIEAQIRSGVDVRADRDVTALAIRSTLGFMPVGLDCDAARTTGLTVCFKVVGIGAWAVEVADGHCEVSVGAPAKPELTMSFSDERTFASVFQGIKNPLTLIATRRMRIKGMSTMATFAKLFPNPSPDRVLRPPGTFSLAV